MTDTGSESELRGASRLEPASDLKPAGGEPVDARLAALLLANLLDHVPDSVYFKDAESRFLAISQSLASRFGVTNPAQAVGRTDADYFDADHTSRACDDERQILDTGTSIVGKDEQETWPDGSTNWVHTSKMPLLDADGKTVGTFGISRDITERKKSESLLANRELRARLLYQATAMAAEKTSFDEALKSCVHTVCRLAEWPVGHVYLPDETGERLEPTDNWHLDDETAFEDIRRVTMQTTFERGVGLPGRIWESGQPAWIVDVTQDDNFPRAQQCQNIGVRAAFGFPVRDGGEIKSAFSETL